MKAKFKTKWIEIEAGKLRLHASLNREVRMTRVRRLTREMDLDALGMFAVWRDGRNLYVIDGQHRKLALEELGIADWPVHCLVYEGMTFEEACEQFLKLNDGLTVAPFDKFDKGVKAGRMAEVETKKIIEDVGLRVAVCSADGKLACHAAATDTWKLDQGESLRRALGWETEAWGFTAAAVDGQIVRGLGIVAHRYNGAIEDGVLVKKLAKYPGGPGRLIGSAKARRDLARGTLARNIAAIVIDVYNAGKRSGQLAPL